MPPPAPHPSAPGPLLPGFRQPYSVYFGHHLVHSHGWNMSYVTTNIFFLIWIDFGLMFNYYCNDCTDVQCQGIVGISTFLACLSKLIAFKDNCDGDEL